MPSSAVAHFHATAHLRLGYVFDGGLARHAGMNARNNDGGMIIAHAALAGATMVHMPNGTAALTCAVGMREITAAEDACTHW